MTFYTVSIQEIPHQNYATVKIVYAIFVVFSQDLNFNQCMITFINIICSTI